MLELRTLKDFRARPQGGYVAGRNWLYFTFDANLSGFSLWGSPQPEDMRGLIHVMELELDRPWHAGLVDVTRVEGFSAESFAILSGYVVRNAAVLATIISHTSMVRSRGLLGAIATGFFGATTSPFPVSFWDGLVPALEHLGSPDAPARATALEAARAAAEGTPPVLSAMRRHLETHLLEPSIEETARAAGVSPRTLQRRLTGWDTSFAAEVQEARLRAAERKLVETDEPITTIALDLGFSSPQHLSSLFRKLRGITPSEHRERSRR